MFFRGFPAQPFGDLVIDIGIIVGTTIAHLHHLLGSAQKEREAGIIVITKQPV